MLGGKPNSVLKVYAARTLRTSPKRFPSPKLLRALDTLSKCLPSTTLSVSEGKWHSRTRYSTECTQSKRMWRFTTTVEL